MFIIMFARVLSSFSAKLFPPGWPKHVLVPGVVPPEVQDFPRPVVELHDVLVCPFLQPVHIPLDGSMTLWYMSYFSQFCVICQLAEDTLYPIVHLTNEDVK